MQISSTNSLIQSLSLKPSGAGLENIASKKENTALVTERKINADFSGYRGIDKLAINVQDLLSPETQKHLLSIKDRPLNEHSTEVLAYNVLRYATGELPIGDNLDSQTALLLTDDDLAFLKKASGGLNYIVFPDGSTIWVDDEGKTPVGYDEEHFKNIELLASQIGLDRSVGNLEGPISREYLENLLAQSKGNTNGIRADFIDELLKIV